MYSQAPFSQGNATTWKEAICSETIRLTLFSSRLGSKRKAHLCLSGDKVPCSRNAEQLHGDIRNPCCNAQKDSARNRQGQAARAGVQQVFPSL